MTIGRKYLVKCGWGDTKATLEFIVGTVYHFKTKDGFKFVTHGLESVSAL